MPLARIFKPIRHQPPTTEAEDRVPRMEANPVTNTSPSGPSPTTPAEPRAYSEQEEGWLALLEIVFDETGWPDA